MSEREKEKPIYPGTVKEREMVKSPIKGIDMQARSNDGFDTFKSQGALGVSAIHLPLVDCGMLYVF